MAKLWMVATYEYRRQVFNKSFVLTLLVMPLVIVFAVGVGALINKIEGDDRPIGYVDHTGLLADPIPAPRREGQPMSPAPARLVPLLPFDSEASARTALEAGEIQAYYAIAANYLETGSVELVYTDAPRYAARQQFWDFMLINRLTDLPPEISHRAVAGSNLIVRWPASVPGGGREFSQRTFLATFIPLFGGLAFILLLFMSSGSLMGAIAEEKENRTMEILVTSLSPGAMMAGKILGIIAVAFTQLMAWILIGLVAVLVGGNLLGITLLQSVRLEPLVVLRLTLIALPSYVLFAALMTALGATVTEVQEAQQATALFAMPAMAPYWFAVFLLQDPNSPLAVGLSLFPLTSLSSISLRMAFGQLPGWQIAAAIAITAVCAAGAVWLAGRAFRMGMLRYGQRLSLRDLLARTSRTRGSSEGTNL